MLTGVAFCPQAPALVPEVGRGLDDELGPVRDACRAAIRRVAPPGTHVVVVGGAGTAGMFTPSARGSFAAFGVDLEVSLGLDEPDGSAPADLPPSLAVGAWLVRDALGPDNGATGIAVATEYPRVPEWDGPTALVVLGDGSARRSLKAPGHLDPRAVAFDAAVVSALASGEGHRLNAPLLEEEIADELMVTGIEAWDFAAGETEALSPWNVEILKEQAPFGVGYFVAAWTHPEPYEQRLATRAAHEARSRQILADVAAGRATVRIVG